MTPSQTPAKYGFCRLSLDELPEFGSRNLETLRQPLEDKVVTISRAAGSLTFPANFMFVAAMNPCQCGYFGDDRKECTCGLGMVQRYQSRISGPLMDRIDIHVDVMRVPFEKLVNLDGGETSAVIRARVEAARKIQAARFATVDKPHVLVNGDMGPAEVQQFCLIDDPGKNLMQMAVRQMDLSARSYHRVLKLARTIADLAGVEAIAVEHLAEALQYRPRGLYELREWYFCPEHKMKGLTMILFAVKQTNLSLRQTKLLFQELQRKSRG